jgi:2-polyprenyl-3-methyl-5-hydroxy-6-metoxy-1,4-benzoquinol methylase
LLKKKSKTTNGIDDVSYKSYLEKKGHNFFSSFDEAIRKKKKFDIVFSLSELEHKYNPIFFLKKIKKVMSRFGTLILRIPNYYNIYSILLGKYFYKYDYRTSHNFYFSVKNIQILLDKVGLKTKNKFGLHEYEFNHLLAYIHLKKRVYGNYKRILAKKNELILKKNIENSFNSTSLVYILKK